MAKEVIEMEIKSDIGKVAKDTEKAAKAAEKLAEKTKKIAKATKEANKSQSKFNKSIKGMGTALKAAGIGLVVTLFLALREAIERNQTAMDLMDTVLNTISITFNQVATVISDVYKWVTDSTERFDGLTKVVTNLITIGLAPLQLAFYGIKLGVQGAMLAWEDSFLGGGDEGKIAQLRLDMVGTALDIKDIGLEAIEAGKSVVSNMGDAISEIGAMGSMAISGLSDISIAANIEQGKAATNLAKNAKKASVEFEKLNIQLEAEAVVQRELRDNELLSFDERYDAIDKLNGIQEQQNTLKREQAQAMIDSAEAAFESNATDENYIDLQKTKNNLAKEEAEILSSTNEIFDDRIALNDEWNQANQDQADKDIALAEKVAKKKVDLEDAVAGAKKKTLEMGFAAASSLAKEGSAAAKGIAVARTIFNTQQAIMNAMATVPAPYNVVQAGITGAMGAAAIADILGTDPNGSTGGGATATATPAPQMMSGSFDISGGVAPEPVQAFVITDEMTNSQNQLANIRRRATI